LVLSSMI
jgi:hypothetical protein